MRTVFTLLNNFFALSLLCSVPCFVTSIAISACCATIHTVVLVLVSWNLGTPNHATDLFSTCFTQFALSVCVLQQNNMHVYICTSTVHSIHPKSVFCKKLSSMWPNPDMCFQHLPAMAIAIARHSETVKSYFSANSNLIYPIPELCSAV